MSQRTLPRLCETRRPHGPRGLQTIPSRLGEIRRSPEPHGQKQYNYVYMRCVGRMARVGCRQFYPFYLRRTGRMNRLNRRQYHHVYVRHGCMSRVGRRLSSHLFDIHRPYEPLEPQSILPRFYETLSRMTDRGRRQYHHVYERRIRRMGFMGRRQYHHVYIVTETLL